MSHENSYSDSCLWHTWYVRKELQLKKATEVVCSLKKISFHSELFSWKQILFSWGTLKMLISRSHSHSFWFKLIFLQSRDRFLFAFFFSFTLFLISESDYNVHPWLWLPDLRQRWKGERLRKCDSSYYRELDPRRAPWKYFGTLCRMGESHDVCVLVINDF